MREVETNRSTAEKLLLAAIEVMAEKGYLGASTKEIAAAAGVNEVTLFRHFGCKSNLLEAALDRYHYADIMTELFATRLTGELESDLHLIAQTYQQAMFRNKKLIRIVHKEGASLPIGEHAHTRHREKLRELLRDYFTDQQRRGLIRAEPPDTLALSFMYVNYGCFISRLHSDLGEPDAESREVIRHSVELYARALKL